MSKEFEQWINELSDPTPDYEPFSKKAWDHQQFKIDELQEQLNKAKELLETFASMGPKYKTKNTEKACWACDMGDAGYSSGGEGFHDDSCPIMLAQKFLEK